MKKRNRIKTEKLKAAHKKANRTEPKLASFGGEEKNERQNKKTQNTD